MPSSTPFPSREALAKELKEGNHCLPVLCAAMVAAAVFLLLATGGAGYYQDELSFIYSRSDFGTAILMPYVDSLIAIPLLIYQGAFGIFGLGSAHLPIRLIWVAEILACSLLLFLYLRRRTLAWFAFLPACVLLVFGAAWTDQATTLGLTALSSVTPALGSLVALDRRTLRADLWAAALLTLALVAFSASLPFAAGVAVTVVLRGPPDRLHRAWIWLAPLAVYGVWAVWAHLTYQGSPADLANVAKMPGTLLTGVSTVIAGLAGLYTTDEAGRFTGLNHHAAGPAALLLAALGVLLAVRRRLPREALVGLSMLLTYWVIVALVTSPVRGATTDRYQYVGAVLLVITLAPVVGRRSPPPLAWAGIGALFVWFSLVPNIRSLSQAASSVEQVTDETRAGLTALEVARDSVRPDFDASAQWPGIPGGLYLPGAAGSYLAAVHAHGSPAFTPEELLHQDPEVRQVADVVLVHALQLSMRPAGSASHDSNPTLCSPARQWPGTASVLPVAGGQQVRLGSAARGGAEIEAARFGDGPGVSVGRVGAGQRGVLSIPRDRAPQPWRLRV
ncbi:MAG: hypothetical protein WBV53_03480, partial [Solirubrobacterales bacterium]